MVAFSVAVLGLSLVRHGTGGGEIWAWVVGVTGVGFRIGGRRREGWGLVGAAVLSWTWGGGVGVASLEGARGLVEVEAVVSAPATTRHGKLTIPVGEGWRIQCRTEALGPLPGARIEVIGRADPLRRVVEVASPEAFWVRPPAPLHIRAQIERLRRFLRERLAQGQSETTAGLLRALMLGDRTIPTEEARRFAETGTLHLFAVSGMHLVLLAATLRPGLGRRPWTLLLAIGAYAVLTGLETPVGRALIMTSTPIAARALGRVHRPGPAFALALALCAHFDPEIWSKVGAWLSFSAAAGITFLSRPWIAQRRALPHLEDQDERHTLVESTVTSLAAFAASAPIVAYHFNRVSLAAIPGTLLLGPLVNLLMAVGVVKIVLPEFAPTIELAEVLVTALGSLGEALESIPGLAFEVVEPSYAHLGLATAAFGVLAHYLRARRPIRAPLLWSVASVLALVSTPSSQHGCALLDAASGSALFHANGTHHLLADAGPASAHVADQLLGHGVRRIDLLLLSHAHADHCGGEPDLRRRLSVGPTLSPFATEEIRRLARGDQPDPSCEVLWPSPEALSLSPNERSAVLRLREESRTVLATGDLETRGLRMLLDAGDDLGADWVTLPHHGRRNDALLDLGLRAVPQAWLLPARHDDPHEGSLLTLRWLGLPLHISDRRLAKPRSESR